MLQKKYYNLYISSTDKVSGTHNNAVFNINWNFLPDKYKEYEVKFCFQTAGGIFTDNASLTPILYHNQRKINSNLLANSEYNYDTASNSNSTCLGYARNDVAYVLGSAITLYSTLCKGNSFYSLLNENPSKIIIRPSNQELKIWIQNLSSLLNNQKAGGSLPNYELKECNTSYTFASDMPPWTMTIQFSPI